MGIVIKFPEWAQAPAAGSPSLEELLHEAPPLPDPIDPPAWLTAEPDAPVPVWRIALQIAGLALLGWFMILAFAIVLANHSEPVPVACPPAAEACPVAP